MNLSINNTININNYKMLYDIKINNINVNNDQQMRKKKNYNLIHFYIMNYLNYIRQIYHKQLMIFLLSNHFL